MDNLKCAVCSTPLTKETRYLLEGFDWCETHYKEACQMTDPQSLIPSVRAARAAPKAVATEQRYTASRFLILITRLVGFLALFGIAYMAMIAAEAGTTAAAISVLAGGGMAVLILFAAAEGLQVLLDMEEHQRAIRSGLERQK